MTVSPVLFFSIIVPVYNGQYVIQRCIESVLNQTHEYYELIIIDDGSVDETEIVCLKCCKVDDRIKYYKQSNSGVSCARNRGIDMAQNEHILFVDADDYLAPDFVSNFSEQLIYNDSSKQALIVQDFIAELTFSSGVQESHKWCKFSREVYTIHEAYNALGAKNWLAWAVPFAKLFKLSIIRANDLRFHEKVSFREDFMFMIDYIEHVELIVFEPIASYHYTIDKTKQSLSSVATNFEAEIIFFDYIKHTSKYLSDKYCLNKPSQELLNSITYSSFFRCINSCMYKSKIPMARKNRIKNLRRLSSEENIKGLLTSGVIDSKVKMVAFTLLKNRLYVLYDLLNELRFRIA